MFRPDPTSSERRMNPPELIPEEPPLNVLVIDDEPSRAMDLVLRGHNIRLANDLAQTQFWLNHPTFKIDAICFDHDMGHTNGRYILEAVLDQVAYYPIWIWSLNEEAAKGMERILQNYYDHLGEEGILVRAPIFGSQGNPAFFREVQRNRRNRKVSREVGALIESYLVQATVSATSSAGPLNRKARRALAAKSRQKG